MSENRAGPAVTAVIPAYNMEAFLGRALESALAQTYPHLEIVVIDDGATDGTRAIAEAYAARNERVRVVSVANGGVAAARNLGTRMANTPYVAFLDADDLWHPEKIARQVAALAMHGQESEWVGCCTLSRFIDVADRVLANGPSADERGSFFEPHLYRNHLGLPRPRFFAYPFGDHDHASREEVRRAGFDAAFGVSSMRADRMCDRFDVPRVSPSSNDQGLRLSLRVNFPALYDWLVGQARSLRQ